MTTPSDLPSPTTIVDDARVGPLRMALSTILLGLAVLTMTGRPRA